MIGAAALAVNSRQGALVTGGIPLGSTTIQPDCQSGHDWHGHRTFHLVPVEVWEAQAEEPEYLPEASQYDRFIHCTDSIEELLAVGNRYYLDDLRSYITLEIDCGQVKAPILYEDDAGRFPHIYGALNRAAVVGIRTVTRSGDGLFIAVGGS